MFLDLYLATLLHLLGLHIFGRFEEKTPLVRKMLKLVVFQTMVFVIVWFFGSPWGITATCILFCISLGVHTYWCRKHGISILTAEPMDKYYKLRGWV